MNSAITSAEGWKWRRTFSDESSRYLAQDAEDRAEDVRARGGCLGAGVR
ncbi:hypothetical protein [Streptomyces sp. NPDC090026]